MSKSGKGSLGCLVVCVALIWIVSVTVWEFLKASWPTWAFLLVALALLVLAHKKRKNLFFKATEKVLTPIILGLGALMALELLFGLFRASFDENRVGYVEDAILKAHFVTESFEHHLGYAIPLAVAIAVAFLCLTVGNWQYSIALAKVRDVFRFLSVALLVMASFTFFRHSAANTLLDWEKDQSQRWYEMALAEEERSVARLVASRELFKPLSQPDEDSKKNFAQFFGSLKSICERVKCFRERYEVVLDFYENPTVEAFHETIHKKVSEDYAQFVRQDKSATDVKSKADDVVSIDGIIRSPALQYNGLPLWIEEDRPAEIDLASSKSPREALLSRRASSQKERQEQKRTIEQQQKRSNEMKVYEWQAKHKMITAFASALAASVPDAEGIIGAYVKELVDATAEWIVRPVVNQAFKQGYRPETIQDLHFAVDAVPQTTTETFSKFHATATQSSEISRMDKAELVEGFFKDRENSADKLNKEMIEQRRKWEEEREHEMEAE
jgi:hypothetical protein